MHVLGAQKNDLEFRNSTNFHLYKDSKQTLCFHEEIFMPSRSFEHTVKTDQTGLIEVFADHTFILLGSSLCRSFVNSGLQVRVCNGKLLLQIIVHNGK